MKKPIQISIPTPCHENWQAMTPEAKGRFCASCQKTVLDFTKSSDREIALVLKNTENACGRFRAAQLDRDLVVPKEKSTIWMAAGAAVVSFLTIGTNEISAQTPVKTEQEPSYPKAEIMGKVAAPVISKLVKGTVYDNTEIPIPGANILNLSTKTTVITDFDGNFSIEAQQGDSLEVFFVGYDSQRIVIKNRENMLKKITLKPAPAMMGDVYIEYERSFFGRIFHSIGNIFR